uniref:Uncharacterized protein n=1 Tax=Ditylenchus dipsaci TaxID=166011 RepID=A0A915CP00_9BILA
MSKVSDFASISSSAHSTGSIPDNKPLLSSTAVQDILSATSKLQGPELANAVKNLQALFSTFSIQSTPAIKSSVDLSRNSYYDDLCLIDFSSPEPIGNPMSLIDPDLKLSSVEAPIVFPDLSDGSSMTDSPVMSADGAHRDSLHMVSIRSSSPRSHSVYEEVQLAGSQLVPALGERETISPVDETPVSSLLLYNCIVSPDCTPVPIIPGCPNKGNQFKRPMITKQCTKIFLWKASYWQTSVVDYSLRVFGQRLRSLQAE